MLQQTVMNTYNEILFKIDPNLERSISFVSNDSGNFFIEISTDDTFFLVARDRGIETYRVFAPDIDSLMYLIFEKIAYDLAWKEEALNRGSEKDSRKFVFLLATRIIGKLSQSWEKRMIEDQAAILSNNPYF